MGAAIELRGDFDGPALRRLAKATRHAGQARRLLALATIYDGGSRGDAACIGNVGRQTVRDWASCFNAHGPEGLVDGKAPGNQATLGEAERLALREVVEAGPIPAVHGVVRWRLKDLVQATMGWFDYHLWEFTVGTQRYGLPMEDNWDTEPCIDASKVRLRDVLKPRRTTIDYLYDFGDGWEHRLIVSRIRAGEPGISYPRPVGGEWNAPPEDCGGIPGFYEMLDALADAQHPDHTIVKEWLDDYDPKAIDELPIKYALSRIANRRNAARARLAKQK